MSNWTSWDLQLEIQVGDFESLELADFESLEHKEQLEIQKENV